MYIAAVHGVTMLCSAHTRGFICAVLLKLRNMADHYVTGIGYREGNAEEFSHFKV